MWFRISKFAAAILFLAGTFFILSGCGGGGSTPVPTYTVSGKVAADGTGIGTVQVRLASGGFSKTAVTDGTGTFTFTNVPDGTYTVSSADAAFGFDPASVTVSGAAVTISADFTAYPVFSISGKISLLDSSPLAGVTMTLSGDRSDTVTTGADGTYTFTGLPAGSYTVTPSKNTYVFNPDKSSVTITNVTVSGQDFAAAKPGEGQFHW